MGLNYKTREMIAVGVAIGAASRWAVRAGAS